MSPPLQLSADHVIYSFSARHRAAVEVESGTILAVHTRDAYDRLFRHTADVQEYLRQRHRAINPATGPIAVKGLQPGDGLDVTIESIELGDVGYIAAVPGIGVMGDAAIRPRVATFRAGSDGLWSDAGLRLPLRPMVGTIGLAPAEGEIATSELGYHGGNLDCNDIACGATLHLPVQVPGGLLALGDVHASMGFGEVYSGVNIDAVVTLRLSGVAGIGWRRPWLENPREVMTLGVEDTVEQAIRQATLGMTDLLQSRLGVSLTDAIILTGAACDVRLGQASRFGTKVSAYAAFPKSARGGAFQRGPA